MLRRAKIAALVFPMTLAANPTLGWEIEPHNAVYELTLAGPPGGGNISAVQGTMTFTWDQGCDGWVVEQNYQIDLLDHEGGSVRLGSEYSAIETLDGSDLEFESRNLINGLVDEEFIGEAIMSDEGGRARYSEPSGLEMALPVGTLFPTEHSLVLLDHAEAGERFFVSTVFDGTSSNGVSEVSSIIGQAIDAPGPEVRVISPLLMRPGWSVSMAYFDNTQQTSEPTVELNLELLDNGVVRAMQVDYGTFAMEARLIFLEPIDQTSC
jgi:hypothetical protein